MDVKSAFLHGGLSEEIYMEQPLSFMKDFNLDCQLKNSLYGLNQAPRAWYKKIDPFFVYLDFKHCEYDHSICVLHVKGDIVILVVYIDDLVLTSTKPDLIFRLKSQLANTFEMIDLGISHFFLGLQVLPLSYGLFVSQSKYVLGLLKCFKEDYKACVTSFWSGEKLTKDCESPKVDVTLYRRLVDSLIYLTQSRPNISFAASVVSRFM